LRKHVLLFVSLLLLLPLPASAQDLLVGTWNLASVSQTENGQSKDYLGPPPLGQVIFGADGRFSDIVLRSDLPKFKSNNRLTGTADENAAVVSGSIAYFGTYTLSGDTLKMHIDASTFPNWENTDQTLKVRLSGDQLTWESTAASRGGSVNLVFQRGK
jgi:hypothetical protein